MLGWNSQVIFDIPSEVQPRGPAAWFPNPGPSSGKGTWDPAVALCSGVVEEYERSSLRIFRQA
jgi:hypothetical protein